MSLVEVTYLAGRLVGALLCAGAAALALRALAGPWALKTSPRPALTQLLALLVGGATISIVSIVDAFRHTPGAAITSADWAWLTFDVAVLLLGAYIIILMRQRDRLRAQLTAHASTDSLTGLSNRRSFDARALEAIQSSIATRRTLAILAFDIDRFKSINDTHGHQVGDTVLRSVAAVLMAGMRQNDLVSRIGGEEFVALPTGRGCAARDGVGGSPPGSADCRCEASLR